MKNLSMRFRPKVERSRCREGPDVNRIVSEDIETPSLEQV
jgi:hypothetical protein